MTTSLSTRSRFKTVLIITGSILVIAGIAAGTILALKHFTPIKMTQDSSETKTDLSPIEKADALFAKGDYTGAKSAYQNILQTYQAQNNEAGAKDIELQLQIIDATAKSQKDPQNTDEGRVVIGSKPQ